jgi:hypothetical protein
MSDILNKVYIIFILMQVCGAIVLDVMHFPVWPKGLHFPFSPSVEQWYIKRHNDPLSAGLPTPNGWQTGMYLCEQFHTAFFVYFLFAKGNTIVSGDMSPGSTKDCMRG